MEEDLADVATKASDVLHWAGKYKESNALGLLARLCRAKNLDTLDKLERFVTQQQEA